MTEYARAHRSTERVARTAAAIGPFVAWFLAVYVVAVLARSMLHIDDHAAIGGSRWLPLANFDANYYIEIAAHGYVLPISRAFFPALPLLMAGLHGLVELAGITVSLALAGTIISVACSCVALVLLRRLLAHDLGERPASRSVWLLLCFPYAFILIAPYSESVLLLSVVGSFLAARHRRWWLAGALAAVASACRLPGLIVVPALLVEYHYQVRRGYQRPGRDAFGIALAPLGAIAYFAWLSAHGGISTYNRAYSIGWPDRKFTLNVLKPLYDPILLHVFHDTSVPNTPPFTDAIALACFIAVVALLIRYWKRLRPSYQVFSVLTLLVPLVTTITEGLGRYYLVMFPLVLCATYLFREHRRIAIAGVTASVALQVVLIALFAAGHPGLT